MKKLIIACLSLAFTGSLLLANAAEKEKKTDVDISKLPPASDKKDVTYATGIKPIFEKSCIKCHGAEKQKGKLRLDSLEAVLKGGQDGKVVEPGASANEDDYMPPPDNKDKIPPLTKEQIGLIRAWIDQGAK